MKKDVIYIDVEDDITSIIGKVKDSEADIIALVPPKRIGAIQSAVNLKLVHRAAEKANKRLVIITNNAALLSLAGSAGIPIAKSLQSRPEMAEVPALEVDGEDDIIDGAAVSEKKAGKDGESLAQAVTEIEGEEVGPVNSTDSDEKDDQENEKKDSKDDKKGDAESKIPDFNIFRKRFFIGLAAAVLLIGFSVWAFVIAPRATVVISAQTSDVAINTKIKSAANLETSLQEGSIKLISKTKEKSISKTFTATGRKDVGEKATGTVLFKPTSSSVFSDGATIPAGTVIQSRSGARFTTNSAVVFDSDRPGSVLARGISVGVTAVERGSSYNGATGAATGPSGFSITFTSATSGGTDKTITVVQQSDIDNALTDLITETDKNEAKSALQTEFGDSSIVIGESFAVEESGINKPAADSEVANGQATITGVIKFSLSAIEQSEVEKFLSAYLQQQIDGKANQKVYSTGAKSVTLTGVSVSEGVIEANLTTNGKVGPKVDESAIKEYVKGKNLGEVQERIKVIEGVASVDVEFSPFWVRKVPNDNEKIDIQFKVDG